MQRRRFLVTGCGRSGTGYMASLLTRLGALCGHEVLFNPDSTPEDIPPEWPESLWGESSWLAAPFLYALPEDTLILHQVRAPLSVVRSFARLHFFESRSSFHAFARRHCAALGTGSQIERCARYWVEWNRLAQRAESIPGLHYLRYRVEDVDQAFVGRLMEELGCPVSEERVAEAIASMPCDFNSSGDRSRDVDVTLEGIDDRACLAELERLAASYGYAA